MERLPVLLLTGFLGAGKTTMLNQILKHLKPDGLNIALIINEFGRINIDKMLVNKENESIFEVNQGSIFCVCTRDQFFSALKQINDSTPAYDLLIMEATGIANTGDLNDYINDSSLKDSRIRVVQNICMIDAVNFHKVLSTLPAVTNQVEEASVCIISKTEQVTDEQVVELKDKLGEINPRANIVDSRTIDLNQILQIEPTQDWRPLSKISHEPPELYSVSLELNGTVDFDKTVDFLRANGNGLVRAKGFFQTHKGNYYIELINDKWGITPYNDELNKHNKVVLIGGPMDEETLQKAFELCVLTTSSH